MSASTSTVTPLVETAIEATPSGLFIIFSRVDRGKWKPVGHTASQSEAVDTAFDTGKFIGYLVYENGSYTVVRA